MSGFEAGMLVCFGISWPVAIRKTLKTKSVHGKSKMFLSFVLCGYGLGITHKIIYSLDIVLCLYIFNFLMVLFEICLCRRYQHLQADNNALLIDEEDFATADTLLAEPDVDVKVMRH